MAEGFECDADNIIEILKLNAYALFFYSKQTEISTING